MLVKIQGKGERPERSVLIVKGSYKFHINTSSLLARLALYWSPGLSDFAPGRKGALYCLNHRSRDDYKCSNVSTDITKLTLWNCISRNFSVDLTICSYCMCHSSPSNDIHQTNMLNVAANGKTFFLRPGCCLFPPVRIIVILWCVMNFVACRCY